MKSNFIDVVESAYDLGGTTKEWLSGIARHCNEMFGRGTFAAFCYDATSLKKMRVTDVVTMGLPDGTDELIADINNNKMPLAFIPIIFRAGPDYRTITGDVLGPLFAEVPREHWEKTGFQDTLGLRSSDPTFKGVVLCTNVNEAVTIAPRTREAWARVGAHVAAAYRLRQSLAGSSDVLQGADAILDTDGKAQHAEGDARERDALDALREAVRRIDRARTSKIRQNHTDEALEIWHGLVAGTWSLIDHHDTDGRRYIVARKNDPSAPDPRALTTRERQVAAYAGQGHDNKQIAYDLGIGASSVAAYLASAMGKLQLQTRVELVHLYRALEVESATGDDPA